MKFDKPSINIFMFEEDIVLTEASGLAPVGQTAEEKAMSSDLYVEGNTIILDFK